MRQRFNIEQLYSFSTTPKELYQRTNGNYEVFDKTYTTINIDTWINFNSYVDVGRYYGHITDIVELYGNLKVFGYEDKHSKKYLTKNPFVGGIYVESIVLENLGYIQLPKNFMAKHIRCEKTYLVGIPNNLYYARRVAFQGRPNEDEDDIAKYYEDNRTEFENKFEVNLNLEIFPTLHLDRK